jgi:uncharacterized protein
MTTVSRTVPAPAGLGTEVIGVPEGSDLDLDLRLESVMEGVLVSGTASATVAGECVRCLDDVEQDVFVDVQELFVYPGRAHENDEDELRRIEDELIDFEPALRDAVVLALPFQPVCSPDCPGLCSQCGARLADDPDHQHVDVDPRWAALQGLAGEAGESTENEQGDLPHDEKES